ncbi:chloramphenicol-sensitive protein RarD [Bacillus tianshenii]|uniref:Chloramphenicol-sensitive protein RarD n=1 Tax=Sutcliffiella tianshenii TaxID=1463404 RepID=A0ABS2NYC0_9BACI|nr:EamA family transporter RarD [Bacillus tianshenii]MBM7619660.1 chloramphenicol-sensitive protein RarD [Bacillus tianshenii]
MNQSSNKELGLGIAFAALSYMLWGILPLIWKLVDDVPASEILAHRVVWSLLFMLVILLLLRKFSSFFMELKALVRNRKRFIGVACASVFISINWGLYIWAVNEDRIIEASLGYYINPLVSILLAVIVLKEKLSVLQTLSIILAGIGVLVLTVNFGSFPWVAIMLAVSFAFYGLIKKMVQLGALVGLAIETLLITPFALMFLTVVHVNGGGALGESVSVTFLLLGAGVVTAIPLLLFASGARRIPLSMIGLLQYIAPTIKLIIGVYLFHEPFTAVHLVAFTCIWLALVLYTLTLTKGLRMKRAVLSRKSA